MIEILLFLILLVLLFGAGAVVTGLWWLFGVALVVALIAGAVALTRGLFRFFFESWKNIFEAIGDAGRLIRKISNHLVKNPQLILNVFIFPYPFAVWVYKRISPFDGPIDAVIHGTIGIIGWLMISALWLLIAVGALAAAGEALGVLPFASQNHR